MTPALTPFTPVAALIGGALIGLAAALLMLLLGRIAGISGIAGGLLKADVGDRLWRLAFLTGLCVAPLVVWMATDIRPDITIKTPTGTLIFAGLLVGLGTRIGAGCTSGHGVCGLARLSPRSLVATFVFMAAGIITVTIMRYGLGGL